MTTATKIVGKKPFTEPSRGYIRKRRHLMRKSIEEEAQREWNEIESDLTRRMETEAQRRHFLIRSSPQMIGVAEMLLAGEKPMSIVRFLRKNDPERFGEHITDAALLGQVLRFKEEVVSVLEKEEGEDISTTRLDFYARLSGKQHVDVHAMLIKLVLFQETRLCTTLENEKAAYGSWIVSQQDKKLSREMEKAMKSAGCEVDRYWKLLMSLGVYEVLLQPCSEQQREFVHKALKLYRGYLAR